MTSMSQRGAKYFDTSDMKTTNSGSEFREAKSVGEGCSEIRITLWKGKFDQVIDRKSYHITNLITQSYNGLLRDLQKDFLPRYNKRGHGIRQIMQTVSSTFTQPRGQGLLVSVRANNEDGFPPLVPWWGY